MARRKGGSAKRLLGWLSISHLYVLGVVLLAVVLGYPCLRGRTKGVTDETQDLSFDIRVMVLNGCGVRGVAEDVASSLRDYGFDIVGTGNADAFDYRHSLVVDRCGSLEKAERVSRALDCRHVLIQRVRGPGSDVVVVVGADWQDLRLRGVERRLGGSS